jgi:hypothetical protein
MAATLEIALLEPKNGNLDFLTKKIVFDNYLTKNHSNDIK